MSPGQQLRPAGPGKAGCSWPPVPAATADHPAQKGHQPGPLNHLTTRELPGPPPGMTARSQNPAVIKGHGADSATPQIRATMIASGIELTGRPGI